MYRLLMEQDVSKRPRIEGTADKDWVWLDEMLTPLCPDQDFPFGRFGMAELTYAPFFERYALNEYFLGFCHSKEPDMCRAPAAVFNHDVVRANLLPSDHFAKLYADYALGFANGASRRDMNAARSIQRFRRTRGRCRKGGYGSVSYFETRYPQHPVRSRTSRSAARCSASSAANLSRINLRHLT
jgi:hypothetical protein